MLRLGPLIVLGQAEYNELVDAGAFVVGAQAGEERIWCELLEAAMAVEAYLEAQNTRLDPAGRRVCAQLTGTILPAQVITGGRTLKRCAGPKGGD